LHISYTNIGFNSSKGEITRSTGVSVAAEKNVDFPTFALPSNPICNTDKNVILLISIAEIV